jgi:hypothetical protein
MERTLGYVTTLLSPVQSPAAGVSLPNGRRSDYPILPLFLERRSSRAFADDMISIPYGFHAECLVAVGRPGSSEHLPARLQTREAASQRRALHEIAFDGEWEKPLEIQS